MTTYLLLSLDDDGRIRLSQTAELEPAAIGDGGQFAAFETDKYFNQDRRASQGTE